MSYRVPASSIQQAPAIDDDVSSDAGSDRLSDWASSLGQALQTKSLFSDTLLPTPAAALEHDAQQYGFDIKAECLKKGLDLYGRMRLINWIRREGATADQAKALDPSNEIFMDESLLIPVIPDDPLLQLDFDDEWSDDEASFEPTVQPAKTAQAGGSTSSESAQVTKLETELQRARDDIKRLQTLVQEMTFDESDEEGEGAGAGSSKPAIAGPGTVASVSGKGKGKAAVRDDDTHYFDSYEHNDIHEIMLRDTTRTISYARFILSNPQVFKDAIVMDVGCGTGILSMFAARAGAKHVYAIEASGLASKARENIAKNGLTASITVLQSKVEDVQLPESVKHVDVIVSEWMGYMLLYESMLDSVISARDRFLAPSGLMVPSQTRLVLTAITGEKLWKERVDFWKSIYGFDMSEMNKTYFGEGLIDVMDAREVVTDEQIIKDVDAQTATVKSLDFSTPFTLTVTEDSTTIRAFLTHFDTFFSRDGKPTSRPVDITKFDEDDFEKPVGPVEHEISFTTGPRGQPTHWKQVGFLIPEPIHAKKGDTIKGTFTCRKSAANSRELDVDLHYQLQRATGGETKQDAFVGMYRVR